MKLHEGIFYLVKFIILKNRGVNPKSSPVKNVWLFPSFFGVMIWVKMFMVTIICGFLMNFNL